MNRSSHKLSLLLAVLAFAATCWCCRSASADVQSTIHTIEAMPNKSDRHAIGFVYRDRIHTIEAMPNKSDRVTQYLDELTKDPTAWTDSERLALIRKLAEHLCFLGPLHGPTTFPMDTELWKDLLEEGFEAAPNDLNICYSLCQIYLNEQDYARALPVAEAYASVDSRPYPHKYAAPAFLEWCRSHVGGNRGLSRPVFDLHFVVITANSDAHAAMTESKCRSAAYYLTQEFRSLSGEQLAEFRFKSLTTYDVASTTGCNDILAYGDITPEQGWDFDCLSDAVNDCTDARMKDPNAINCYIHDYGEYDRNGVWDQANLCCHGRCNNYKPIIVFDWERLITRDQTPEAHEMGHGFGLDHVCIPGGSSSNSTNIMGSSRAGFDGSGGQRDLGFTEAQVAIVTHCARNIHAAPFGIVVRELEGRDTHTAGSGGGHEITFYLQNLGSGVGTVQAFANGVLLRSFRNLAESEERTLTISGANRVILRARSGSMQDEKIVHLDDNPPTFTGIDVFPNPQARRSVILSARGIRDDGYWNWSDYQVHVSLDGTDLQPEQGISITLENLSVGQHHATMRIADGADRLSQARTVTFTVDSSGPSLTIISPAENATVRPGGNLQITIEAGDAQGIMRVSLYLDRVSDDEFDSTSLGVFAGVFGVGSPERRERTVTANWALGSHKLIAVATDNSGATTTVERTFRVAMALPDGPLPGSLPDRRRRRKPDPRQSIQHGRTRIVPPMQGSNGQSRPGQNGNASQTRRHSTLVLPTQQAREQGETNSAPAGSRLQRSQSSLRQFQPEHRVHSSDEGKAQSKTESRKTEVGDDGGSQSRPSSRVSAAAPVRRTATPPSDNKKKTKVKLDRGKVRKPGSDEAPSSETIRTPEPDSSRPPRTITDVSARRPDDRTTARWEVAVSLR